MLDIHITFEFSSSSLETNCSVTNEDGALKYPDFFICEKTWFLCIQTINDEISSRILFCKNNAYNSNLKWLFYKLRDILLFNETGI